MLVGGGGKGRVIVFKTILGLTRSSLVFRYPNNIFLTVKASCHVGIRNTRYLKCRTLEGDYIS